MTPSTEPCSVEEAVRWYRAQPGNAEAVRNNYFDLPVVEAAMRFAGSEEFLEIRRLLGAGEGRDILDIGAGNGIASHAFAADGWRVTALEPDPSGEIGAAAIRELQRQTGAKITVEERAATPLPFSNGSFDAIFARQVLHHLPNLAAAFLDFYRMLRPGGTMLATREHVVSDERELRLFLEAHPLHKLHGQEHAFSLDAYLNAARAAGFGVTHVWGPVESILNYFPGSESERRETIRKLAGRRLRGFGKWLLSAQGFLDASARKHALEDRTPGRIFAFLFKKPA